MMAQLTITFEVKQTWWIMPVIFLVGIFYKVIFKEPSNKVCKWLTVHGFTMEQVKNES